MTTASVRLGQSEHDMRMLLSMIQHALRNGCNRTRASLALDLLCDLLRVDPKEMPYEPGRATERRLRELTTDAVIRRMERTKR